MIGLPSAGLHSNGHSLARKVVLEVLEARRSTRGRASSRGASVADELLRPTIIYADAFSALRDDACRGRPRRTSPAAASSRTRRGSSRDDALAVELDARTWDVPPILQLIASAGVADDEMRRTFNMGLGHDRSSCRARPPTPTVAAARTASRARVVGKLVPRAGGEPSRLRS